MQQFVAHATFWFRPDRVYRVYVSDDALYLIRIGGQPVDWAAAFGQLGLLGKWLGDKLNARRNQALAERMELADRIPPDAQIQEHKHNLRIPLVEVASARFSHGRALAAHGAHAAAWTLTLRSKQSWRFQIEDGAEARTALDVLSRALGERLVVAALWDPEAEVFRKVKAEPSQGIPTG